MLKDVNWSEDRTYSTNGDYSTYDFFCQSLKNSDRFDIQLGYFNSATICVLSSSFATFIKNGGRMRMAINQIVSKEDKQTIIRGEEGGMAPPIDIMDWRSIKESLDEYGEFFFKCIAYLIQENRIEIRIIKPKGKKGIAHTKLGQFFDEEGMSVGFSGSANFTLGGLFNNLEDLNIFLSTSPDPSVLKKLQNQASKFDEIMSGKAKNIEYLNSKDLEIAISQTYGNTEIDDLVNVEAQLRKIRKEKLSLANEPLIDYNIPEFPYKEGPRDYQRLAFENWKKNGQKGMFAMATGTGKTITSLNCLLEIYKRCGYYRAIILVPTVSLVYQWEKECKKFHFSRIIKVCSKDKGWSDRIKEIHLVKDFVKDNKDNLNYIVICTYSSFVRPKTFRLLNDFERTRTLFIADEAHNLGATSLLKKLKDIIYLRRIGLSATPERQFDDNANKKISKFFGVEGGYTFEYTMKEAIDKGVLCRYYYYPHLVELTSIELEKYVELSLKIAKYFNIISGTFDNEDEILKKMLLERKRIIHKAENKLNVFKKIIKDRYKEKGNLKYTLVYVPEGNKADYLEDKEMFSKTDEVLDDFENEHLIDVYTNEIRKLDKYMTVREFIAGQNDREELLNDFAEGKIQVLTSMKCLDEGVDVPRSEVAIFCSSTGNPRQFIQRRGRILRIHKDKHMAIIHDLIVIPAVNKSSDSYKMEQRLLMKELERVKSFSLLSENPSVSELELNEIMNHYGLNLHNNNHILYDTEE